MSAKVLIVVVMVTAVCLGGIVALHGHGHKLLAKWIPAIHGGR
jgi:hypothetical protein